jgi:hypothetical protein
MPVTGLNKPNTGKEDDDENEKYIFVEVILITVLGQ